MANCRHLCWILGVVALPAAGCTRWISEPAGDELLKTATPSRESVAMEVVFTRVPFGEQRLNDELWQSIDEQHLDPALRDRLQRNGIRAGLVGGHVPEPLVEILKMTDQSAAPEEQATSLVSDPLVRRRSLQLRPSQRGQIIASDLVGELPVLLRDEGRLGGETYRQAQCIFAIELAPRDDGRMDVRLTPEIHHGKSRQNWQGQDGVMRMQIARPKRVFEQLQVESSLAAGQMLVLTCLPELKGSLGHRFFAKEKPDGTEQSILLVRLAERPPSTLFDEPAESVSETEL